jgi:hypothetical protein
MINTGYSVSSTCVTISRDCNAPTVLQPAKIWRCGALTIAEDAYDDLKGAQVIDEVFGEVDAALREVQVQNAPEGLLVRLHSRRHHLLHHHCCLLRLRRDQMRIIN